MSRRITLVDGASVISRSRTDIEPGSLFGVVETPDEDGECSLRGPMLALPGGTSWHLAASSYEPVARDTEVVLLDAWKLTSKPAGVNYRTICWSWSWTAREEDGA